MSAMEFFPMISPDAVRFVEREVSVASMRADMEALHLIERVPNASNHRLSARHVEKMMRRVGLEGVGRIQYPLDGRTCYGDLVMPQAWECREGFLELLGEGGAAERLADWREHPACVAMWSASTPPGGSVGQLVAEASVGSPAEAAGKVVLVGRDGQIRRAYARFKDSGALGLVHCGGAKWLMPDAYHWENSWTDFTGWYPHGSPVALPCVAVHYSAYQRLSGLADAPQPTKVRLCVQATAKDGETDIVTGTLPGRTKQEFVCLAHLYEPILYDDCSGAAAIAEVARVVKAMVAQGVVPRPERTLRLLAGWEYYGFNAFYQTHAAVRRRTFAGASFDGTGIPHWLSKKAMEFAMSSPSCPSFLDAFLWETARERFAKNVPSLRMKRVPSSLSDDTFLGSSRFDIPVYWLHQPPGPIHHMTGAETGQIDDNALRAVAEAWSLALAALLVADEEEVVRMARMSAHRSLADLSEEAAAFFAQGDASGAAQAAERLGYHRTVETNRLDSAARMMPKSQRIKSEIASLKKTVASACDRQAEEAERLFPSAQRPVTPPSKAERQAANIVPRPKILGHVHCLARLPEGERPPLPPLLAKVDGWFDGKRDLAWCIRMAFQEEGRAPSDGDFADWTQWMEKMAEYGYFTLRRRVARKK